MTVSSVNHTPHASWAASANCRPLIGAQQRSSKHSRFLTLDALRGVAALIVFIRHSGPQFGLSAVEYSASHMAVDLFFVLSGFVLANAYESKLVDGTLGVSRFMLLRYIRLFPLYLLAMVL